MNFHHIPVLPQKTVELLNVRPEGIYVDGTAGGGGHSALVLERLTTGRLICLDRDPDAISALNERFSNRVTIIQTNFADMAYVLHEQGVDKVDGILLDLGVSSHQLDTPERGFSYHVKAPLDMRMGQSGLTAAEFLDSVDQKTLAQIIYGYSEEKFSSRIASAIKEAGPIEDTLRLAEIISRAVPAAVRRDGHPARKTFQAIRMAVNEELQSLERALSSAFDLLKPGGRLAVITFHSLEDRPVKQFMVSQIKACICPPDFPVCICGKTPSGRLINKKPFVADEEELKQNPRAKSAKLRVIEKI